jgi:hypothetical protein
MSEADKTNLSASCCMISSVRTLVSWRRGRRRSPRHQLHTILTASHALHRSKTTFIPFAVLLMSLVPRFRRKLGL